MCGFGGVVSFVVKGGREKAAIVTDNVKVASLAVSLGAAETLIEHPASMTHSPLSDEELIAADIQPGLIRLSVGLENVEDIVDDLKQAFEKI
jgi:methionine-gamma-lyase